MPVLADYLEGTSAGNRNNDTAMSSSLIASPIQAKRFTPAGLPDSPSPVLQHVPQSPTRTILKRPLPLPQVPNEPISKEPSPIRSAKRLSFAQDGTPTRYWNEDGTNASLKPLPDAVTSELSPVAQRAIERYRENMARLLGVESPILDANHYNHLAPSVRMIRGHQDALQPVVRRPVDTLVEGQVALLDHSVQDHMHQCEQILGMKLRHRAKNGKEAAMDALADELVKQTTQKRWKEHMDSTKKQQEVSVNISYGDSTVRSTLLHSSTQRSASSIPTDSRGPKGGSLSPIPARFVAGGRSTGFDTTSPITGQEVIRQRREQREAQAALARLEKDPEVKRQKRLLVAISDVERRAALYQSIIAEQAAKKAERERGRIGSKVTSKDLIDDWRRAVEGTVESDEMEEERDRARSLRKALRVEREDKKRAEDILSGLTTLQLEEKRRKEEALKVVPGKRKWRITKMGSVDAFAIPRWSSRPQVTLRGDVILEENDSQVIDNVTWIDTAYGWIPVQVSFGGMSRTQLFAEAPQDEGEGVVAAMLDELDEAYEKIIDAMTFCPPEQLKSQQEVKEMLKHMEFTRQSIRDLPGGRRDLIRRIWDDMQNGKAMQKVQIRDEVDEDGER